MKYKTIMLIPDTQFEPGKSVKHMNYAGQAAKEWGVDCVVQIGDYNDHPSSCKYDKDKPGILGSRNIRADYEIGFRGNEEFEAGLGNHSCRRILTRGNHDERPRLLAQTIPAISGLVEEYEDRFENMGWEVYPYQEPVKVSGVYYSHMFTRTTAGKSSAMSVRSGASSAKAQLQANLMSCTAGHSPGFQYTELPTEEGLRMSMIAGSFYPHKMKYPGPQGNKHFQGIIIKHMLKPGTYDFEKISLTRLKRMYG